jgi:hypothetical protein
MIKNPCMVIRPVQKREMLDGIHSGKFGGVGVFMLQEFAS